MSSMRTNLSGRSLTIASVLMLSTALAAPAFAQIEEVVVTAQKKSEDIQQVPIAVSAFTSQDLAAHQIAGFADLQFNMPSVSFSHGNFGPSNFTIRGIGSAAVSVSGDSGVSVNINQVYLNSPPLTSATYYDTQEIQVLRGPQSTLWGRNATGGAIDIETIKPDLDNFQSDIEGTYGNYNDQEARVAVNIPIVTDQLAARIAGFWENRDGTVKNIYPGLSGDHSVAGSIDGRDDYSLRGSVRWQPTDHTTLDVLLQASHESDSRVRGQVQLCDRDPSGILGCLPDKLGYQATNGNATLGTELSSTYFLGNTNSALAPLGLFDLTNTDPYSGHQASPGQNANQIVPHSLREVDTPFTPTSDGKDLFGSAHLRQDLTSWLQLNLTVGFDNNSGKSQESYNNTPGDNLNGPATCTQLFILTSGADTTCAQITGLSRLVAAQEYFSNVALTNYNQYFKNYLGTLPVTSVLGPNNTGIANLNSIVAHRQDEYGYDQIDGRDSEWSAEGRLSSSFNGPFNFSLGFYHNADRNDAHYYVDADTLDYTAIVLGGAAANGYDLYPSQYDNNSNRYTLLSNSVFGEVYYDAIPDVLKFTAGARYSSDTKSFQSGQVLFNGIGAYSVVPIGTTSFNYLNLPESANATGGCGSSSVPSVQNPNDLPCFSNENTTYHEWTGRGLVQWTPTLDFTDSTNIYASYSRGVRDGGFNPPPLEPGAFPLTFAPETLDAIEVGAKNSLLNNTLIANLTGWYYDYKGFQVSEIVDRTAINQNINSKLWGVEGELFWAPVSNLQFNATFGYTHSSIENQLDVDPRNPLGNNFTNNSLLVKDATNASMCVINGTTDPMSNAALVAQFHLTAPPAPTVINGVTANTAFGYGACTAAGEAAINGGAFGAYTATSGNPENLKGNEMPNTPPWTLSAGVQYTFDLGSGYTLVPRGDIYWTDSQWARIFEDGADRIPSYWVANAQIQLNAPDSLWYARLWVKNIADRDNETGQYLTDASSGLFTNVFVGEPRTYGLTLGAHF